MKCGWRRRNPCSLDHVLHPPKHLLLKLKLVPLKLLLLSLVVLLLLLELILSCLQLSYSSGGRLRLSSLVLPHPLKDSCKCGVRLRWCS